MRINYWLFLVGTLQITDGITTQYYAGRGLIQESNPLAATMVSTNNYVAMKVVGAFLSIIALWFLFKHFPRLAMRTTTGIVVLYSTVLIWNIVALYTINFLI
ncbi:MAG: DUF5658 family protein [Chloroflexi bacterium]|nr:DUF5658 family protein [Chloroflexota bacterium]